MDEELEKLIGKFVLCIRNSFFKMIAIYLIFMFIVCPILFIIVFIPTFLVGIVCAGIENVIGMDTSLFRHNYLSMPMDGLNWLLGNILDFLFDFLPKTKLGLFILTSTILGLSLLDYRKKEKT